MSALARCSSCLPRSASTTRHGSILSRSLATEASAGPSTTQLAPAPGKIKSHETIGISIVVNRSPFLTRIPSRFERAFHAYQQRIERALHNPFPYEFYFKQGSLLETKFRAEERKRERMTLGAPFGTIEPQTSAESKAQSARESAVEALDREEEEIIPRRGKADEINDVRSLDRKGERNLYLLLLKKSNSEQVWRFPEGSLQKGELLHESAERNLLKECGVVMDTWVVSRNPIGLYKSSSAGGTSLSRLFFYKAHIMAGQVRPDGSNVLDYAWLTKQEMEERLDKEYWHGVQDMLSDF
ncbi:50S ribosomal subunit L30 [Neolentinus lepideus HHB14362 ss-1]|uniref:Large ribosomal subunit protein mL46 n=1 Tax=Neolentinus lepideus HHB14362 ss-1 TaxID=1314782 RepID=A0A165T932_9AGAM|nr:50S ribosomal subunit L30 [Neolentinus lepideus HHB14362 ss-1]